jgi:type IV pilus assembly protein PilC
MPHYRCLCQDAKGKKLEIIREAPAAEKLILSINETGSFLISYSLIDDEDLHKEKKHFSKDTIIEFTDIMSSLLVAGLSIQDSLELCASMSARSKTASLSRGLLRRVTQGAPFHQTLKIYGSSFSTLYQALITLAEKTGSASGVFSRLASYLRAEKKIRGKLENALWYPALILLAALIGCAAIIFYVMPRMTLIFSSFNINNTELFTIELSRIYRSLWVSGVFFIFLVACVFTAFFMKKKSDPFALLLDRCFLSLPVLGPFIRSIQTLTFAFAMEVLTGSGITVNNALKESAAVIGNRAYQQAVLNVHAALVRGEHLSKAFSRQKEFPPYISTWIAVGEKTGSVDKVFAQIRDYFQSDVDHGSERLMGMIEPALTLLIGIVILLLIVQFVLPVFSLYGRII